MRILAFVDSHGSSKAMRDLEKSAKNVDIVVCAGDVSIFEQGLDKILRQINSWGKPVLMLHGNHESETDMRKACQGLENIEFFHKKAKIINNVLFMGYGGGGFEKKTPGMADFFKSNEILLNSAKTRVFMFHAPPYKTKIDHIGNSHNGNQTSRGIIIRYHPDMVVCGHFHETAGKTDSIGRAIIVNPGPYGFLIEL